MTGCLPMLMSRDIKYPPVPCRINKYRINLRQNTNTTCQTKKPCDNDGIIHIYFLSCDLLSTHSFTYTFY